MPYELLPIPTWELLDGKKPFKATKDISGDISATNELVKRGVFTDPGLNPTNDMTQPQLVRAGAGKFVSDAALGARQRFAEMRGQTPSDLYSEAQRRQGSDAPLMQTPAGMFGNVAAGTIATLPISGGVPTAAIMGGIVGGLQPTTLSGSATANAVLGAGMGGGGQMAGRTLTGMPSQNLPARQALVDTATGKYGIPLPISARTGSKPLAYLESQLAVTPGGGRMGEMLQGSGETFTKRVMGEAGASGELATQAGLKTANTATGKLYDDIWSVNNVKADNKLLTDLIGARDLASRMLTPPKQAIVQRQIDNILDKVGKNGEIEGNIYQTALRPELRSVRKSETSLDMPMKSVQKALDDAANRSLSSPEDVKKLAQANYQYAVGKAIERHIPKAESRGGVLAPSEALNALGSFPGNAGELGKIAPILREPPQSGTVPRAFSEALLRGGGGAAAGAGMGYYTGGNEGAAAGAVGGAVSPYVAARLLSNPAIQSYAQKGALRMSPPMSEATVQLLRSLGIGSLPLLQGQQQ